LAIEICPLCRQRFSRATHNLDYIHECTTGDPTLDNVDILQLGDFTDFSGSGSVGASHLYGKSFINDLQGTEAGVEGSRFGDVTDRGIMPRAFFRQRPRLKFLDFRNKK